uniref:WAK_assoc domain-containing protein n=1 Tax=Rhabditophanes sp. KR3021 TaxID=114890 RepID=A0AC35UEN9_9BILA
MIFCNFALIVRNFVFVWSQIAFVGGCLKAGPKERIVVPVTTTRLPSTTTSITTTTALTTTTILSTTTSQLRTTTTTPELLIARRIKYGYVALDEEHPHHHSKCDEQIDLSGVFISSSVSPNDIYESARLLNAEVCDKCKEGYTAHFSPALSHDYINTDDYGIVKIHCQNSRKLCICDTDSVCYEPNNKNIATTLYPICIRGICSVYSILYGNADGDAMVSQDGAKAFYVASQFDTNTYYYHPIDTEDVFIRVASVSCNGCGIKTCNNIVKKNRKHHK